MPALPVPVITIGLLIASNVFVTGAWYGHLKFKSAPLIAVILINWRYGSSSRLGRWPERQAR
jgi:uncharacterized protein